MQRCIICEERKMKGIRLSKAFICEACEHNMIHTDVREMKYRYYIEKLKDVRAETLSSS